jgi:hypothetical protein
MKLNSGEFETNADGVFEISITQESDWSQDGGFTFEDVTNAFELDSTNAKHLIAELQAFCDLCA